jgi:gluconolactonase
MELLASGYTLIEGPRVDAADRLYFSDVHNGGVYRRSPDGEIETVVPKRRGVGGIALHADGGIVCSGRNICHVNDGVTRVLFDPPDTPGFNDIFVDPQGRVICGTMRTSPFTGETERTPGECWRIEAEGEATELYGDISLTNGIGFSPDGRTLYHADTARGHVIAHDVTDDGRCLNRRGIAEPDRGRPDGLAVDEDGCLWVACFAGGCVTRFDAEGRILSHLEVPARNITSVCFGGSDRRDLYVVTAGDPDDPESSGSIFRTRAPVAGLAVPMAVV